MAAQSTRDRMIWLVVVALVAALAGFMSGANISQAINAAKPTQDMLQRLDAVDQALIAQLQDPRSVTDDLRALEAKTAKLSPKAQAADLAADIDGVATKYGQQNAALDASIWKAHQQISAAHDQLKMQGDAASQPTGVVYDQLRRFLKWTGPAIALVILALALAMANPRVRSWLERAKSVGLGPLSVAVGDVAALKQGIRERFTEVDDAIVATYNDKIAKADLQGYFARLKTEVDKQLHTAFGVDMAKVKHRATLYVPGFTDEQLVQATKYLPPETPERPVIGRRFSARYGMIGRAYRLRTSLYNWSVDNAQNSLVRYWGLTRGEAYKQGGHQASIMAFPIPPDQSGEPLAIVYIEADGANQLMPAHTADQLKAAIAGDPDGRVQADVLANDKIWQPLWTSGAVQPLYEVLQVMKAEFNWDAPLEGRDGQ